MQLSEAIRLGSMLKPQAFHGPSRWLRLAQESATCALAAAAEAAGDSELFVFGWDARWPVTVLRVVCPACSDHPVMDVVSCVAVLNDYHQWTRERIADWVETIEGAEPQAIGVASGVHDSTDLEARRP
jgi:hypothetical protein